MFDHIQLKVKDHSGYGFGRRVRPGHFRVLADAREFLEFEAIWPLSISTGMRVVCRTEFAEKPL